ncbi:MAG TPA: preprotein translocase subunit SecE [Kiritimatiellia bacterium]|nr:preprotein translocase subunit SecE [Kiritimatiellia bacterium]HSA19256.1 preprotein translocase subunit SecE [Kiritimatiellia bacterium]
MSKIQQGITAARTFIEEVRAEMKKCSWPTRSELSESTMVVIVSVVLMAVFVGLSDVVLMSVMRMVIR